MSTKKTPRERLREACEAWCGQGDSLYWAAIDVLAEPEPEPAPRAMTKAERKLCDWVKRGVRYSHPTLLTELANAVWDEAHPPAEPKRTLEDVERDLAKLCSEPLLASELWDRAQPLMNERQKLLDEEKES